MRPVLRCCFLASYVPLTALGSASVPAMKLLIFIFSDAYYVSHH